MGLDKEADALANVVESVSRFAGRTQGKSYVFTFDSIDPTADNDLIAYMKNTGNGHLDITQATMGAITVASSIRLQAVTGTVGGGDASTRAVMSKTLGQTNGEEVAGVEVEADVDVTGLVETGTLDSFHVAIGGEATHYYDPPIVVPPGEAIAIGVDLGGAVTSGAIHFERHPETS